MQIPTIEVVEKIITKHQQALNLSEVGLIEVAEIGRGEANLNTLITINGTRRLNLRLGLRGVESAQKLQHEFTMLKMIPVEIGPTPYLVDVSEAEISAPYMLLSYVEGALKKSWQMTDLEEHAQTLARLHQRKFNQHGMVGHLSERPFDFLHRFDVAVDYWQANQPTILKIPTVKRLLLAIRKFITKYNQLFTQLSQFSVVHGDAHPLNILFSPVGIRYIDWEWATIGDSAADVAMIGWDIPTGWQMELTGERLERYLSSYLAYQPDETLLQRRDLWMVYTMYFDQIYHRTQIPTDTTGKQDYTVAQIESYLVQRFL